jgi:hypothetical protein
MTNDNFCLYLQNRLIQTSQTGVILPPLVFPGAFFHAVQVLGFNAYVFWFGCLNAKGAIELMLVLSQMMRAKDTFRI